MKTELRIRGGGNLRYIRKRRNMSVEELSEKMMRNFGEDISPSAIQKYESGERPISQEHTAQFAKCLDCSVAALMDGMDLNQMPSPELKELRKLPRLVHEIFYWVATVWRGNIVALATAWGLYAAMPEKYRRIAMMELLMQKDRAVRDGAIKESEIPECIRLGIPILEKELGGLYVDE